MMSVLRALLVTMAFLLLSGYVASCVYCWQFMPEGEYHVWRGDFYALYWSYTSCALMGALLLYVATLARLLAWRAAKALQCSAREESVITPALITLQSAYRQRYRREIYLNVMVSDEPYMHSSAFARRSVALSKGLLQVGTRDEIAAVLAREAGHIHWRDAQVNDAFYALLSVFSGLTKMLLLLPLFQATSKKLPTLRRIN